MAERVNTGGLVSFNYSGKKRDKASNETKKEIALGYLQYEERKIRERKNKIIILAAIIILLIGGYLILRFLG